MTSITKALDVLELCADGAGVTLADLERRTAMPRSTLLRILAQLSERGFLQRSQRGTYRIGLSVWRLGSYAVDDEILRERVRPVLDGLVDETGESAHFAVYEHGQSLYVDKVDGSHPIRAYTAVGQRSPAHATATGKAMLAWTGALEIDRVSETAQRFTDATYVGRESIRAEAERVRRQGYAVNRGEWRDDVWGVAAALDQHQPFGLSAVGISGPGHRIADSIPQFSDIVVNAARDLPSRLDTTFPRDRGCAATR